MFNFKKKAQEGSGGAAVLVIIIAVAIIFYLLFLPPDERAAILNEDSSNSGSSSNSNLLNDLDGLILLSESPGRLDSLKNDEFDHELSSFSLFSTTNSGVIRELDSLLVTKSLFSEKNYEFTFDVYDTNLMENFLLSFEKVEGSGTLSIFINNNLIAEKFIEKINPDPIKIPKDSLVRGKNIVRFEVSSPGILFFLNNKYSLKNIKLFADITDASALRSIHSFIMDDVEFENLDSATMSFFIDCASPEKGIVNVDLNGFQVYSSAVDCGSYVKTDINLQYLKGNENLVSFSANKGSYIVDQFKIKTRLDEPIYPVYYFEITKDEFELIESKELGINLTIDFVEKKNEYNQIEINIDNRKQTADILETYHESIAFYVEQGNNFIKINPLQGTVDIVNMAVYYYEID